MDATASAAEARDPVRDFVLTDLCFGEGTGMEIADMANRIGLKALIVTGYGMRLSSADLRKHG